MAKKKRQRRVIPSTRAGWREWVRFPLLGAAPIKAKLDTGARTSAIHAYEIEHDEIDGIRVARFTIHPRQRSHAGVFRATAPIVDERLVRSSSGHQHERIVVETELEMGGIRWPIEMTLASRDEMGFRLLLGRTALRDRLLVDPGRSFLLSRRDGTFPETS